MGPITILDTVGGGLGPFVIGFLYDTSGAYAVPFLLISGLLAMASLCASLIRVQQSRAEVA